MKSMIRGLCSALTLFIGVSLTACGGGGGDAPLPQASPAQGPVSQGVITALGSVVVNGVTFSTTDAAVKIDDNPSAADQLKVGMVVKVRGTSDDATRTGTATLIEAADALEGTVQTVGANSLTVMGQTVLIEDNVTRLNDDNAVKTLAAAGFQAGDRVEVHAFPDDQGGLRATRVVKKATGEFSIKGFVISLTANSFGLSLTPGGASALTVNFTGALPAGTAVGSFVEVKAAAGPAAGASTITATAVQLEDAFGPAGEKAKVEGFVTSGNVNSFMVNGQRVVTTAATLFEGGLKTDFAVGVKVEAEGPLDANGAIAAIKVSFRSNIRIEADVTAVTPAVGVAGDETGLEVRGKTVAINKYTRIDRNAGARLAAGNHVEVRAVPDRDGNLIATRIVVRNPDVREILQGPVTVAAGAMTILGTAITTNAQTQFRVSFDASEQPVTSAAFFAQVKSGVTVVKVRWANAAATTVEQAEIQVGKTLLASGDSASQGVVTALGSIFVNGIRFHTGGAAVMIDGVPAAEDKLKEGMVVNVRGTIDDATQTGTATLVTATNALEGTVGAVNAAAKTLTVMGQTVQIEDNVTRLNDDATVKTFAAAAFAAGQIVEVHGFVDDNGGLRATRVAKKVSGEFEVKGFVATIGAGSFGLTLTPGGATAFTVTGPLPAGTVVGSLVEVKANAAPSGGAITAVSVQLEDRLGFAGEKARVEGIVTSGTVADFIVNGRQVVTDAATFFEGGLPGDFSVGGKLEAEGPLNGNGAIVAVKVSFRSNIRIEADVTAVGAGRSSITLLGKTVAINQFTRDDLQAVVGRHAEIRAYLDRDRNLVASRIVDRGAASNNLRAELQGPITSHDPVLGTITILGGALATPVNTDATTVFRISSTATEPAVTRAQFFASGVLKNGVTVVKVRWDRISFFTAGDPVDQAEIEVGK